MLAAVLALAGCSVERVADDPETVSDEQVDTAASVEGVDEQAIEPADADGTGGAPAGAGENTDPPPPQAQPIAFGMPDFPGSVTNATIEELLLEACGTPQVCVELDIVDEHSDDVPENGIIRTDPPAGARVEEGDTVTIVRSAGPAPSTTEQNGDDTEDDGDGGDDGDDGDAGDGGDDGDGDSQTQQDAGDGGAEEGTEGGDDEPDHADDGGEGS